VYENEARPVCFLSSDARRAEFLPNKLTVFLNGFRFFTRQHSFAIPSKNSTINLSENIQTYPILGKHGKKFQVQGFHRKHARSQIGPNKNLSIFS